MSLIELKIVSGMMCGLCSAGAGWLSRSQSSPLWLWGLSGFAAFQLVILGIEFRGEPRVLGLSAVFAVPGLVGGSLMAWSAQRAVAGLLLGVLGVLLLLIGIACFEARETTKR